MPTGDPISENHGSAPILRELLPCPFCRGEAKLLRVGGDAIPEWWRAQCCFCYASSGQYTLPERAAEEWNRRGYAGERQPITEDWLRSVGFKWAQFERQPEKQWLLWIGAAIVDPDGDQNMWTGDEDLGIEISAHYEHKDGQKQKHPKYWSVFFRGDTAGRYHRFIHLRYIRYQDEVIALFEALTGQLWNPANHFSGAARTPKHAARLLEDQNRLDRRLLQHPWTEAYKDPDRAKPLPEHVDAAVKGVLAK